MTRLEVMDSTKALPNSNGWYPTDKGELYWFSDEKKWSCISDRVSEEYPMYWYEEIESKTDTIKHTRHTT